MGLDIFVSERMDFDTVKRAFCQVFGIAEHNIWDGETSSIGDMLEFHGPSSWAVFWMTDDAQFPVKVDVDGKFDTDPRDRLSDLQAGLRCDIAVQDERSINPYAIILFRDSGQRETSFFTGEWGQ